MKKLTILMMTVFFLGNMTNIHAQDWFKKGDIVVSSSTNMGLNFYKVKSSDQKWTSFNINPAVGYFAMNNLILGLAVNYWMQVTKTKDLQDGKDIKNNYNSLSIGPFARYYAPFGTEKIKPFVQAGYFIGSNKSSGDSYTYDYKTKTNQFDVALGFSYLMCKCFFMDVMLGYNSSTSKATYNDNTTKSTLNSFGINTGVGFRF